MRFQCRIGTIAATPPARARHPATRRPTQVEQVEQLEQPPRTARRSASTGRDWPVRAAIASAILAATGCAALDPRGPAAWKVEPVFNVTHSVQSSQAYYSLGQYFDGSMAWDKSIDAYRKAIAADAHNSDAYNALGIALAQAGRYQEAESTLRQAVALAPGRTHVRNNLGYVLLMAGKPLDAVAGAAPGVSTLGWPSTLGIDKPARPSTLEVSNGNGVPGMAARVGQWLERQGGPSVRLSNHQPFTQRLTVVQYRVGHEQAARHVAEALPGNATSDTRPTPGLRSDVRVLLGRDWLQTAEVSQRLDRARAVPGSAARLGDSTAG